MNKPLDIDDLAWEIPWIEEPGGLQPMGSQGVKQDLVTKAMELKDTCSLEGKL